MPEGDSIAKNAARLRPVLLGERVVSVYGTAPSVRSNSRRLVGRTVEAVRTAGKHLVIDVTGGFSVRVHLGMSGRWAVLPAGKRVPGSARLALTTFSHHVITPAAFRRPLSRSTEPRQSTESWHVSDLICSILPSRPVTSSNEPGPGQGDRSRRSSWTRG